MAKKKYLKKPGATPEKHDSLLAKWRSNLLAGLVVVAPLYLTYWIITSAVDLIDSKAETLLPTAYNPQTYLNLPGLGLIFFIVMTALIGALAKNLIAVQIIKWGEQLLDRLPIVRSIYNGIKQIAETVLVQSNNSFERACLVEYPRKGIWAIAFISTETRGEVSERAHDDTMMSVFLPTTPNPTSGFLLFVPKADVVELRMSVEEAAKLVISAGLVSPPSSVQPEPEPEPVPARAAE